MNLKTIGLGLALGLAMIGFVSTLSAFANEGDSVMQAFSTRHTYNLPSQGGYACQSLYDAANVMLEAVQAKNGRFECTAYGGAWLQFWSLQEKIPHPEAPSVPAFWLPQQITLFRGGAYCADVAYWMDWLLDRLAVRNVRSAVFCDAYNGYLSYQFEALVPYRSEPSPIDPE